MRRQRGVGTPCQATPYTRTMNTIDTEGYLAVFCMWMAYKHAAADRLYVERAFTAWLGHIMDVDWADTAVQAHEHADCIGLCEHSPDDGFCVHVLECFACLQDPELSAPQQAFAKFMIAMVRVLWVCPAAKLLMTAVVRKLARHINERLEETRTSGSALLNSEHRQIAGRRRRWDEAFRTALDKLVEDRKVVCPGQNAVQYGVSAASVGHWNERWLAPLQAAGVRNMQVATGTFLIASDGRRLGKPAREMVVFQGAHHGLGVGQWLAPQEKPILIASS